jgi:outer membrane protein assembly factor BamB
MKNINILFLALAGAAGLFSSCNDDNKTSTLTPPQAAFSADKNAYTLGDTVFLTDNSTPAGAPIVEYYWHFGISGANAHAQEQNTWVVYSRAGKYAVKLTVTDEQGAYATAEDTVLINPVNLPPTAQFSYSPASVLVNETVDFTDLSTDVDGSIAAWLWDFGNGATSTEQNPQTTYTAAGSYNVSLTVTDDRGATNSGQTTIIVSAVAANFGDIRWATTFEAASNLRNSISPAVGGNGEVYITSDAKKLHAIALDGSISWSFDLTQDGADGNQESSPIVGDDGTVYIGAGEKSGGTPAYLYALNSDGTKKWHSQIGVAGGRIYYTPPAIAIDGNIILGDRGTNGVVQKFNKTTGATMWSTAPTDGGVNGPMVVDNAGNIYIVVSGANGVARKTDDGVNITPSLGKSPTAYTAAAVSPAIDEQGFIYAGFQEGVIACYDPATGSSRWEATGFGRIEYSGISISADGSTLYCGTSDAAAHRVVALNNSNGSTLWSYPTVGLVQSTPAVDANGIIHFGDDAGNYVALNPDGTVKLTQPLGTKIVSSPVIADYGVLYIAVQDGAACKLVAIDIVAGPANSAWAQRGQNARRTGQQK